ncbi:MAG: universal stress protein [Haloarculaceae archaeon]
MAEHVLVPYDASPLSEQALSYAIDHHPDADITVFHALDPLEGSYGSAAEMQVPGFWEDSYDRAQEEAEELLADAREFAADRGATVETELVVGRPDRSIVEFADEEGVDHVVMGSHGRSGLSRILVGSVAENVMRRAHCPVTIVR